MAARLRWPIPAFDCYISSHFPTIPYILYPIFILFAPASFILYSSVNFTFITLFKLSYSIGRTTLLKLALHQDRFKDLITNQNTLEMYTSNFLVLLLAAAAEARYVFCRLLSRTRADPYSFGQEQGNGAIAAIGALSEFGQSGQAATLSGGSIQFLLAAANPCGKLTQADLIVSELGSNDSVIAAARGLVAAEQNFNPFVVSIPSICSDPTLPTTEALRGVVPLIDPAVGGEALENANSKTSVTTPFSATGLSVAQVMVAQGFSNFTAVAADGTKAAASTLGGASSSTSTAADNSTEAAGTSSSAVSSAAVAVSSAAVAAASSTACGTTMVTVTVAVSSNLPNNTIQN